MDWDFEDWIDSRDHDPGWCIGQRSNDVSNKPVDTDSWVNKDWQNQGGYDD